MSYSKRLYFNFRIGLSELFTNKVRALLTSLGIIFGVASVIAMLAIGRGAEREILEQIKQVGSNNIVVRAIVPAKQPRETQVPGDSDAESETVGEKSAVKRNASPGLQLKDVENLLSIPTINAVSPEVETTLEVLYRNTSGKARLTGVENSFFELTNTKLSKGTFFSKAQQIGAYPVCIIGGDVEKKYFSGENPIGKYIKCGKQWLHIIGVIEHQSGLGKNAERLALRNINQDIFIPLSTYLMRIQNRALINSRKIQQARRTESDGNYHQLDKLVVHVSNSAMIAPSVDVLTRMLQRRHAGVKDFEIIVPEQLLRQEQKTKQLFNLVLAIIASISLIVGGIGIMNIMLASVLERTREIGLRLAVGATKRDVVQQFLSEAISLCVVGGLIGVVSGIGISFLIRKTTGIETIVSMYAVMLAFSISALIGLLFGWLPARKAAANDPVVSLRSE